MEEPLIIPLIAASEKRNHIIKPNDRIYLDLYLCFTWSKRIYILEYRLFSNYKIFLFLFLGILILNKTETNFIDAI